MSKRRYTKMQVLLPTIERMIETGMSHREIEAELRLEGDRPVHNLLKRQRRKDASGAPKFRRRKPAKTLREYKYENKRLQMEVKLLQDFLQSTKAKYAVIHNHWKEYSISVMCKFFKVSRSGYYNFVKRLGEPDPDAAVAKEIRERQSRTDKTYGYRRVWKWLRDGNIQKDPNTVLRIMKKYGLLSEVHQRRQWVNLGQQVHNC